MQKQTQKQVRNQMQNQTQNQIRNKITTSQGYADLIDMSYPLANADTIKHPRMSNADRAKIFAPFAALRGYEEAIAAKQKIRVPRVELSEEAREELDRSFAYLAAQLEAGEHPVVQITYFEQASDREVGEGNYYQFTGVAVKIIESARTIQIVDKKFLFDDIRACSIEQNVIL